jgi:hypothetical protein
MFRLASHGYTVVQPWIPGANVAENYEVIIYPYIFCCNYFKQNQLLISLFYCPGDRKISETTQYSSDSETFLT